MHPCWPNEQTQAIKNALGADKAGPVIQALESIEERVKASMAQELATKRDLADTQSEIIKCVAGMLVAQAAIIATLVKLL